jgi:hypothetical protein
MSGQLTTKTLATLVALSALPSVASAENCRALPEGPERHACAMREHPEKFQAKLEHCRELARDRGDTTVGAKKPGGMRDFVQGCMRGRQP